MDPSTEVSFHFFALGQFHLLSQLVLNYLNVLGCFGWVGSFLVVVVLRIGFLFPD